MNGMSVPHIAIDLGDGTAFVQRTRVESATDNELSSRERAILVLHAKLTKIEAALQGCGSCDWDEAEGGLVNHCAACCRKVTMAAWEAFQVAK